MKITLYVTNDIISILFRMGYSLNSKIPIHKYIEKAPMIEVSASFEKKSIKKKKKIIATRSLISLLFPFLTH